MSPASMKMVLVVGLVLVAVVSFAHSATDGSSRSASTTTETIRASHIPNVAPRISPPEPLDLDVITEWYWPELQRLDPRILAKTKFVDIQYYKLKEPGPHVHVTAFTEDNTLISLVYMQMLNGGDDVYVYTKELHGVKVKSVVPSSADDRMLTILALTEDGSIYSYGDQYMSARPQNSWEYGKIETLPPVKQAGIAQMFCMALGFDGTIYVWGRGAPFPGVTEIPRVLDLGPELAGVVPTSICCTRATCAFLTKNQEMMKWSGPYGNHKPRQFQELKKHASIKLVCGMSTMMVLTHSGDIFHIKDEQAFYLYMPNTMVVDVVAGKDVFVFTTIDGWAYTVNSADHVMTPWQSLHPRDLLAITSARFFDSYTWGSARLDRKG